MVTTIENKQTVEWLKLARERIDFPDKVVGLDYQDDVDLLIILFSNNSSTHSKMNHDKGVLFDYDENDKVVSLEILDLYGVFV